MFGLFLLCRIMQRYERDAARLARHVVSHWKRYVRRKKQGNPMKLSPPTKDPAMQAVVEHVMEGQAKEHATETTGLLA